MKHFLYRQDLLHDVELADQSRFGFAFCTGPSSLLPVTYPVLRLVGIFGSAKLAAKVTTPSRSFGCVLHQDEIRQYAWATVGHCRHYEIEHDATVIGPVWTQPSSRGMGFATFGVARLLNAIRSIGLTRFYIDTAEDNIAMQKVISRCGFGEPIGVLEDL